MNDELSNKLAEKDAEIEQLKRYFTGLLEEQRIILAASQAREVQLMDVFKQTLKLSEVKVLMPSTIEAICRNAISLPADTTALSDMIVKAGEVMREMCISEFGSGMLHTKSIKERIRALPAVTINDLK